MPEEALKDRLKHILNKRIRIHLFNRLLFFVLINTALYLLLLTGLIVFNPPIFPLYLSLFISLSLLPLFLLPLGPKHNRMMAHTVRLIDDHCLIESYLQTRLPAQRAFMERKLKPLIERRIKQGLNLPHFVERKNIYLLCAVPAMLIVFEILSIIAFSHPSLTLSIQALKAQTVQKQAAALSEKEDELEDLKLAQKQQAGEEAPEPAPGAKAVNSASPVDDPEFGDSLFDPDKLLQYSERKLKTIEQTEKISMDGRNIQIPEDKISTDSIPEKTSGQLSDFIAENSTPRSGQSSYQDAGKAFLESPIQDYESVKETLYAEGDRDLKAGTTFSENKLEELINRLFGDFSGSTAPVSGFDTITDQIREKYIRLVHEAF